MLPNFVRCFRLEFTYSSIYGSSCTIHLLGFHLIEPTSLPTQIILFAPAERIDLKVKFRQANYHDKIILESVRFWGVRDSFQISFLNLQISTNQVISLPLELSKNTKFSDDFRGNRN